MVRAGDVGGSHSPLRTASSISSQVAWAAMLLAAGRWCCCQKLMLMPMLKLAAATPGAGNTMLN